VLPYLCETVEVNVYIDIREKTRANKLDKALWLIQKLWLPYYRQSDVVVMLAVMPVVYSCLSRTG
jgi:hypothetical protein